MTPSGAGEPVHPAATQRSHYRYVFTTKHHSGGPADAAHWSPEVSRDEEFSVFDTADLHDISDRDGRFYGVLRGVEVLRSLGTWGQQMAEFPVSAPGQPWHGYPIWAVNQDAPASRRGQKMRPARVVFEKMERAGLIAPRERKRLFKGDHV